MKFFIAQFVGTLAPIIIMVASQAKNKRNYLILHEIAYGLFIISMILLKGYAGAISNFILIILTIIISKYKNKKIPNYIFIILFTFIIIANIITFKNIYSLLPGFASIIYLIILIINDMNKVRKYNLILRIIWLIYDFIIKAYTTFILDIFCVIFSMRIIMKNNIKSK